MTTMTLPQDRMILPAPVPSHPSAQRPPASIPNIRSQSVPTLLRPTGQYQYIVPPRISQTPPPSKTNVTKAEIQAAIASIDHVLIAALGNPKDRLTLTKLETDVQNFLRNPQMTRLDFPPMSSYQRLMAHRIAEYYHMEHTAVDLDNSRRAVVLFKTAGSHCPDVPLCNIPEEDAALASGKSPVNEKSPSLVPGMILQDQVAPVEVVPEEISPLPMGDISKEEEEVFEENSSYEPDPDMPPLVTSEPPKQFKILRRKPSPSPEVQRALITQGGSCPPSSESSGSASKSNAEKTLEEREKDYALARARIFNYENLDGSAAAELAGLTLDDAPQSPLKPTSDSETDGSNETSRPRPDQSPERSSPVNSHHNRFPRGNPGGNSNGNLSRTHSSGSTQYYNPNIRNPRGGASNNYVGGAPGPTQPFNSYAAPFPHWGVSGAGRGGVSQQQPGMFVPTETGELNWFPVYPPDYNYAGYFQPQSRQQVPLFVPPSGMSSPVAPSDHSFQQGTFPMYPQAQPYSRGYGGTNQKGRSHSGHPPSPSNRSDKSYTPPRGDTSPLFNQQPPRNLSNPQTKQQQNSSPPEVNQDSSPTND